MTIAYDSAAQVLTLAKHIALAASAIKAVEQIVSQVSRNNSNNDPDWTALQSAAPAQHPDLLEYGPDGVTVVLKGLPYTPAEIASAAGALGVFLNFYLGDAAITQSAWGNPLEKVAPPSVNVNLNQYVNPIS